nr:MATE family efflux transporter [uncultured Cetobacterium sp.]
MSEKITLENGCVKKLFFKFAIPSVIGMLIVSMQMMVDGIFLSSAVGPDGLAAVNLSMPAINLIMSIALMISIGGGVLAGIAKGNNNHKRSEGLTTLTFVILVGVLITISIIALINFKHVTNFLGVTKDIYPYVKPYLSIMLAGSTFFNLVIFTETFVRVNGKPNMVFISGLVCFLSNVILDYLLIMVLGMGMEGAAIATTFANMFGCLALISQVKFGPIQGNMEDIKNIFYNGSSEMLTTVSSAVTTYIFNLVLMKNIGILGVSALTIVFYINSIINVSLYGLSQALQPIISYNIGAKRLDKINSVLKISFISGAIIGGVTFLAMQFFSSDIVDLFADGNKELETLTKNAIFFITFSYLISFINIIASSFHTAIEKPFESAFISLGRSIIFIIIPLMILPVIFGNTGIWLATPTAELLCLALSIPLTLKSLTHLKRRLILN